MGILSLRKVVKSFDDNVVIPELNLEIPGGELTVLLGPSGCGKSTLLRLIAGLEYPDRGGIWLGDREITRVEPRNRNVAMVFQNYALYPHLTVRENLSFPLRIAKFPKAIITEKVEEAATILGIDHLLDRLPRTLSGGERQRTAVGRAIVRDPEVFLFDEPLSNLDFQLRNQMRGEIKTLQRRLGKTMVFVTHDQTEAMTMADHLVVLRKGVIIQQGTPHEIYNDPQHQFVAGFIGSPPMNFLNVDVENSKLITPDSGIELADSQLPDGTYRLGVRPDNLLTTNRSEGVAARISQMEFHGAATYAHCRLDGQPLLARVAEELNPGEGAEIGVEFESAPYYLFDPETEERVR